MKTENKIFKEIRFKFFEKTKSPIKNSAENISK